MREAGAALDRTPWLTRWRGSGRGSSPVASSTTSAVTRSIPRSSARRSARPHIRLIICGMPSDAAAIRSTASGAKGWAPPLTVRQRKSTYPPTPSASSGARRKRADSRVAAPPSRSASSFASSRGSPTSRILRSGRTTRTGSRATSRSLDRACASSRPTTTRRPGSAAARRSRKSSRPRGRPSITVCHPERSSSAESRRSSVVFPVPGGPVRTASRGASFSRVAIRR